MMLSEKSFLMLRRELALAMTERLQRRKLGFATFVSVTAKCAALCWVKEDLSLAASCHAGS